MSEWSWLDEIEKEAKQTMATMYAMHEEGSKFWGKSQKPRVLNELKLVSAVRQMKAALEFYEKFEVSYKVEGGCFNPAIGDFKKETLIDTGPINPASETLARLRH